MLIVPPALRKSATEILESERVSSELSNTINVHFAGRQMKTAVAAPSADYFFSTRYNMKLLICPWISAAAGGSDTAWYLLEEKNHNINFFDRTGLMISEEKDFDTDALKIKGFARFSYGWSGWKGVYASNGLTTAYSL